MLFSCNLVCFFIELYNSHFLSLFPVSLLSFLVVDEYSEKAYRVLAVGYKLYRDRPSDDSGEELEHDLIFAGLIASIGMLSLLLKLECLIIA